MSGDRAPVTLRDAILLLAEDPGWVSGVSQLVIDEVAGDVPELLGDEELRLAMRESNEALLRAFVDMLRGSVPPQAAKPPPASVEYTRQVVRRGIGVDSLLRGYHAAQAAFFKDFARRVRSEPALSADPAATIEEAAQWSFAFVASLNREVVDQFAQERDRWVRSAASQRLRVVRSILEGEATEVDELTVRLRYPLDRQHLGAVAWTEDHQGHADPSPPELERTVAEVAEALGATSTLIVELEEGLLAGWLASVPREACAEIRELRLRKHEGERHHLAFGLPGTGVTGFRKTHTQAVHARRAARIGARAPAAIVNYPDVSLLALASADLDHARDFTAYELGALAGTSDDALRLAATLRVYLEEGSSARRAANRLGVHENTVKNRVRAAEDQIGHPAATRVAEQLVALRLIPLTSEEQRRAT
jgi:DNA-binding PucR family transcriptional regulator